jgi:peptidoglycan/LPS O-acetylase OafA/YrhL
MRRFEGTRAEIQALRAVAVSLVVGYHLWPKVIPGGFVGVDVFFVISGFLITALLLREVGRTGTLSLAAFWARRARRILPAALVTLLAAALATLAIVPESLWEPFLHDILASTAYVQNWHLAATSVDYFAAADATSPVQHFWSLSLEEQFYVGWPLLMLLALAAAGGRSIYAKRRWIAGGMLAVTVVSAAYGVHDTRADPLQAYFSLPARAWEFGLGGLLALAKPITGSPRPRAVASWGGLIAIVVAALAFTSRTRFPGSAAALPVLGALAVIAAGAPRLPWAPTPLLSLPPVQFAGGISYSVYLWHWPVFVLAGYALDHALGTAARLVVLGLTLLAAWVSKVAVEDPVRFAPVLVRHRPWRTLALALAATGAVLGVDVRALSHVDSQVAHATQHTARVIAQRPRCFGAAARDPHRPCSNSGLRLTVVPTPLEAAHRGNAPCTRGITYEQNLQLCAWGVRPAHATARVLLVGDSHAGVWRAALAPVARAERWSAVSMVWSGCSLSTTPRELPPPGDARCTEWRSEVFRWIRRHRQVNLVFFGEDASLGIIVHGGRAQFEREVAGYIGAWRNLPASVKDVIVLRDNPRTPRRTAGCITRAIAARRSAGRVCAVSRRAALPADPAVEAARRAHMRRVHTIDLTRYFCTARLCPPVIGGVLVYKDTSHVTQVYARTLGPYMLRAVTRLKRSLAPPSGRRER